MKYDVVIPDQLQFELPLRVELAQSSQNLIPTVEHHTLHRGQAAEKYEERAGERAVNNVRT